MKPDAPAAVAARHVLAEAIRQDGPTPCQQSMLPDTWWLPELAQTAVELCAGCPVRQECLDYALAVDEQFGIWGGVAFDQRLIRWVAA